MPLNTLDAFTKQVSDLATEPIINSDDLKAWFDASPNELREHVNAIVEQLVSTMDGNSGADNIKATPIGNSPDSIQGILEWLKTLIDANVLDQIPSGSLTDSKLSNEATDIKQRFTSHVTDFNNHLAESSFKHIKESGSNVNGYYVRFDDGLQICKGRVNITCEIKTAWGALYYHTFKTINFPATFVNPPTVSVNNGSSQGIMCNPYLISNTAIANLDLIRADQAGLNTYSIDFLAIGRWK